jgi:glycosyltransferase involved in cell wall biosynthesis
MRINICTGWTAAKVGACLAVPRMKARLKVCHLLHDGSGKGGGATFALSWFPVYAGAFDTFVITGNDGDLAERLRAKGVRTLTVSMARPWRCLFSLPKLEAILRDEKPDAVIVHGQWGGFFGAIAARLASVPVILYYTHFPSFYTDWSIPRVVRNRIAEGVTCRLATRIVCVSAAARYQYLLRKLADESKLLHLPNCVYPERLNEMMKRAELLQEVGADPEHQGPVVVSVSRLTDQKRIDWLLRAWALVEAQSPRGWLAIVGGGPEEEAWRGLASELGLQRCRFLGSHRDGYRYFRAADFGVICSMFEGQPLALLEAMFCGCAMIGTDVDGIGETIDPNVTGLLVPPADPQALADAILRLMADPAAARRMGEAARLRATELYHAEKILPQQLQLLRNELQNAAARAG